MEVTAFTKYLLPRALCPGFSNRSAAITKQTAKGRFEVRPNRTCWTTTRLLSAVAMKNTTCRVRTTRDPSTSYHFPTRSPLWHLTMTTTTAALSNDLVTRAIVPTSTCP